jgi:acetolactate synthase-1/2/3 large subunit
VSKHQSLRDSGRRKFLKGATLVGAALTPPTGAGAFAAPPQPRLKSALPGPWQTVAETAPPSNDPVTQTTSGGDFMVDVLKTLDLDYLAMNCASSFRGLHEAVLNHGKNIKPEILTCPHEEIAVAMGHGYAKMEGKPLAMICHGVVGLQHASMAIYNAWCDRVPIYLMGGNLIEANKRGALFAEWVHSAVDIGATMRDYTKWDDQPTSLQHFAESAVRANKIAITPPMGPVLLSLDAELQENPIGTGEKLHIPKLSEVIPPQADSGAINDLAKLLVNAQAQCTVTRISCPHPVPLDRYGKLPYLSRAVVTTITAVAAPLETGWLDRKPRRRL